jgi:hypothetical protein
MGYRTYIGVMPKREYNKLKSLTLGELREMYPMGDDDYWYKGPYEFGEKLYEFGKYTDFKPPKDSLKPFFKKKETQEFYADTEFHVVTKEFLGYIIESYKQRVVKYYNDMLGPFFGDLGERGTTASGFIKSVKTEYGFHKDKRNYDFSKITQEEENALFSIFEHLLSMSTEWVSLSPYDLETKDTVTDSWKYEYSIFELVRIYKHFDWQRNVMTYYGY